MNDERDQYVKVCPYCGGTEIITGFQSAYASIIAVQHKTGGCALYHSVCRNCGSVLRSYVMEPKNLLSKKDSKEKKALVWREGVLNMTKGNKIICDACSDSKK